MTNVVAIDGSDIQDYEADKVLENLKGKLSGFVLVGYATNGEEWFSSTFGDAKEALWLLERGKKTLLEAVEDYEDRG